MIRLGVMRKPQSVFVRSACSSLKPQQILIWSAASSVGQFAVQLAKYLQLRVIATASTANHSLLRKLGADIVLDYSGLDTVEQIRTAAQCQLRHAIDCVCDLDSATRVSDCFGSEGGIVATLLMYQGEQLRANVDARPSLCFTLLGRVCPPPLRQLALTRLPGHRAPQEFTRPSSTLPRRGQIRLANVNVDYLGFVEGQSSIGVLRRVAPRSRGIGCHEGRKRSGREACAYGPEVIW